MENQTDNEKNGEDEMESTCDKDEGVTEKSEEEVSFPPRDTYYTGVGLWTIFQINPVAHKSELS